MSDPQLRPANQFFPKRIRIGIENGGGIRRHHAPSSQPYLMLQLPGSPTGVTEINMKCTWRRFRSGFLKQSFPRN